MRNIVSCTKTKKWPFQRKKCVFGAKKARLHISRRAFFIVRCDYAPKLSNKMFSAGTPRLSSIFTTDDAIIGGPHIR